MESLSPNLSEKSKTLKTLDKAISCQLLWTPIFLLEAEAIQNGSGFGFNGYDENGKPKWDLVQNVVIRHVEVKSVLYHKYIQVFTIELLFTDHSFCRSPLLYDQKTLFGQKSFQEQVTLQK